MKYFNRIQKANESITKHKRVLNSLYKNGIKVVYGCSLPFFTSLENNMSLCEKQLLENVLGEISKQGKTHITLYDIDTVFKEKTEHYILRYSYNIPCDEMKVVSLESYEDFKNKVREICPTTRF